MEQLVQNHEGAPLLGSRPGSRPSLLRARPGHSRGGVVADALFSDDAHPQHTESRTHHEPSRSWLAEMLSSSSCAPHAVVFRRVITALIAVNAVAFVLSTVDAIARTYATALWIIEGVTSVVFLVEYLCRLLVVVGKQKFRHPFWGRVRYMVTYRATIDALATFPFFIEALSSIELPQFTWIRVFRLFRLLRTEKQAKALNSVYRVFHYNRQILSIALAICLFLAFSTSIMLFYLGPPPSQDFDGSFASLPATMYLSLLMLAGQGGPEGPLPWYTKVVVLITSVFSVAVFSIPAGMLVWAFEAEAERLVRREHRRRTGDASESSDSWAVSSSGMASSWAEYENVILGGSSSSSEAGGRQEHEKQYLALITEQFNKMDVHQSGQLSLHEFVQILRQVRGQGGVIPGPGTPTTHNVTEQIAQLNTKVDRMESLLAEVLSRR